MPRTSRSVAQRLAAQQSAKSKKRRAPRPVEAAPASPSPSATPSSSVSVDQILDEVVPSEGGARTASTPTLAAAAAPAAARPSARKPGTLGRGGARPATRAPIVRRRYTEYAQEYAYVWADLRRIVIVAGILIALLIALSFILN